MLSINTSLNDIRIMNNLTKMSNRISYAMEKMSTGMKINRARDDVANYSISTKLNTQLREFNIVSNNIQNGKNLIDTAQGGIDTMSNILSRLRNLSLEGVNSTLSSDERGAIQNEVNELTNELYRVKSSTKYNEINLFGEEDDYGAPKIATKSIEQLDKEYGEGNWIGIDSIDALKNIKIGDASNGKIYVLTSDIDLSGEEWIAIGSSFSNSFHGTFDGNGYKISNLTISQTGKSNQGLFGYTYGATIKNVQIEGADVKASSFVGTLVGYAMKTTIVNSHTQGNVEILGNYGGGLVGRIIENSTIIDSSASGSVKGNVYIGGLVGTMRDDSTISNSYASGTIEGDICIGGLVGRMHTNSSVTNSHAKAEVIGRKNYSYGGLVGDISKNSTISDSYATGSVSGASKVGGLVGSTSENVTITNSYSSGNVTGNTNIGGLAGTVELNSTISNSYSLSNVKVNSVYGGGLVGALCNNSIIKSSHAHGNVEGGVIAVDLLVGL